VANTSSPEPKPSTLAVHGGEPRRKAHDSVTTPIVFSATYAFADTAEIERYFTGEIEREEYGRYGNPTVRAAEQKVAALEGAEAAALFASGMAAATTEPDYMRHDTDFHIAVARATGNAFLTRAIEEIRMRLNDAMTLLPESEAWHQRLSGEHGALLEAIENGDAASAEALMQEHVAISEQGLRAVLAAIRRRGVWK